MIICLFILLGQAIHLFWHNEPSERLSHKIVQLGQAVAQLNQRTAVVAALRLQHGRMTISRSVKYSRYWKDERPLSWKRQQCEPSLPQPLHPADGIKRNDETEHQSFVFLLLNHQPVCVFLCLGSLHTSTGHQNQPLNPGILGTQLSSPEMQT